MTALWLGWTAIVLVLCIGGKLIDKQLDRGHEIRWHERFYAPQLPARSGRVIDAVSRPVDAQQPAAAERRAAVGP